MRRIYFLVPDLESAHKVTEELLLARIEERHIHVIAKEGVELGDLPEASLLQTSDVIPAVERGLAVGGATGILAGVAAVTFPPAGLVLGGGAVLATALIGSGMGAWMSSMIASKACAAGSSGADVAAQAGIAATARNVTADAATSLITVRRS